MAIECGRVYSEAMDASSPTYDTPADDAAVLTATVEELSTARSLTEVTGVLTNAVRALTGADGATFVLRQDGKCFYADESAIGPLWKGGRFPLESCISGWAMTHDETAIVQDIFDDERIPIELYRATFVRSLAMAPIGRGVPVGALGAYWQDLHVPEPRLVRKLEVLANSAAVALENLELRGEVDRRTSERDELEQALHSVVHDLRSPLGAMMGYAELISDTSTSPEIKGYASAIWSSGERVADQVDQMLALYRITRGEARPMRVDLTELARRIADELRAANPTKEIEVDIEPGMAVLADPALTEILARNLIGNAFKYSGKAEHPVVKIGRADHAKPFTTFFVSDNGIGFNEDDAEQLFKPMMRLASAKGFPGTGLGLASVARIVDLHGGTVYAESPREGGAKFSFTLTAA